MNWTQKLINIVLDALQTKDNTNVSLPVTTETINLAIAMVPSLVDIDYDMIDEIYIERLALLHFLLTTKVMDKVFPQFSVAIDIDGVMSNIQERIKLLCPEWDGKTYNVNVGFEDFDYLSLDVLDRPTTRVQYILTSRPLEYLADTKIWLDNNKIEYEQIIFASDKLEAMEAYGIDCLLDDNPETFKQVNDGGKLCYLYDATYNQHIVTQLRVKNIAQFEAITKQ